MAKEYVGTKTMARLLDCSTSKILRWRAEKIIDAERLGKSERGHLLYTVESLGQAVICDAMRDVGIGLDAVRTVIDAFDFGEDSFDVEFGKGLFIFSVNMAMVRMHAGQLFEQAEERDIYYSSDHTTWEEHANV